MSEPVTIYSNWDDEDLWRATVATAQNHGTFLYRCPDGKLEDRVLIIKRSGEWAIGKDGGWAHVRLQAQW